MFRRDGGALRRPRPHQGSTRSERGVRIGGLVDAAALRYDSVRIVRTVLIWEV